MGNTPGSEKKNSKLITSKQDTPVIKHKVTGILVVDDVKIMFDIINKYFKHYEHKEIAIKHAQNGNEALKILLQDDNKYNVTLMDIKMSPLNGYKTTEKLVENKYDGLILGVSGMVDQESIDHAIKSGMKDMCSKPVVFDTLLLKMNTYNYYLPQQLTDK